MHAIERRRGNGVRVEEKKSSISRCGNEMCANCLIKRYNKMCILIIAEWIQYEGGKKSGCFSVVVVFVAGIGFTTRLTPKVIAAYGSNRAKRNMNDVLYSCEVLWPRMGLRLRRNRCIVATATTTPIIGRH